MGTILRTPKGDKRFNSYYLAVVEKNKLLKKGIKAEIIDTKESCANGLCTVRENKLRTIYNSADLTALSKIRKHYEPQMTAGRD